MAAPELVIEKWGHLRRELVWIRRANVENRHRRMIYHPHGRIAAWRLLRGRVIFRLSSGPRRAKAGEWIFPGLDTGERVFSDDAEIVSLRFHLGWVGGEHLFDHREPFLVGADQARDLDQAGMALVEFAQSALSPNGVALPEAPADLSRYLTLQSHFDRWVRAYAELMTAAGRGPRLAPRDDPRIEAAARLMESRLRSGRTTTEATAAVAVGLSLSQFKRLFERDRRKTPKRWLDDLRYELACDRLGETGRTVKEIGYALGFRSPNHFSAWFSRRRGAPPAQACRGGAGSD